MCNYVMGYYVMGNYVMGLHSCPCILINLLKSNNFQLDKFKNHTILLIKYFATGLLVRKESLLKLDTFPCKLHVHLDSERLVVDLFSFGIRKSMVSLTKENEDSLNENSL